MLFESSAATAPLSSVFVLLFALLDNDDDPHKAEVLGNMRRRRWHDVVVEVICRCEEDNFKTNKFLLLAEHDGVTTEKEATVGKRCFQQQHRKISTVISRTKELFE
jgi:hypothetical protein